MKTGEVTLITKEEIFDPITNTLKELPEQIKTIKEELKEDQLKMVIDLITNFVLCFEKNCSNINCKHIKDIYFDFDRFRDILIELSKNDETKFEYNNNDDYDQDEMMNNPMILIMEEQGYYSDFNFIKCPKCGNKRMIYRYKGKNKIRQCNLCGGYGVDFSSLEQFKCKINSSEMIE
jgi:ribosomal protein S27E